MDELKWVLTNFQQVSVAGLLAFIIIARFFGWWVDRSTHQQCRDELSRLQAEVTRYMQEDAAEKQELKQEIASLRQSSRRRPS